jgi:hypothetical protein
MAGAGSRCPEALERIASRLSYTRALSVWHSQDGAASPERGENVSSSADARRMQQFSIREQDVR